MSNNTGFRVLLDTNVLLDALSPDRPQSAEAWEVLKRCNGAGDTGFAASGSLKDVYYIVTRGAGERRARASVSELMGLLVVIPVGAEECLRALSSGEPDFEDGLIRACAELNDIDFILTRDSAAFRTATVRSVTCAEYLEICRLEEERARLAIGLDV